jgi:tRNA-dihydrouridine synthase
MLKLAEDCGVEALSIHGRTRSDLFSGHADWGIIAKVKEQARIPIIGNGDVFAPPDAERMFRETGVDGVMIGRGALSNPWLMRQCWDYISGKESTRPNLQERMEFVMTFLQRVSVEFPPPVALGKMKKVGGYLSKGFPGSAQLRAKIHGSHTTEDVLAAIQEHFKL